jgi:RNA polymerase sigma factor (TIGR02999 family)
MRNCAVSRGAICATNVSAIRFKPRRWSTRRISGLIEIKEVQWQNRLHFFAMASRLMRRILVDAARAKGYQKRDAGGPKVSLDEAFEVADAPTPDVAAVDDALNALEAVDPRKCQVVELRFFGGLSVEETAEALHMSVGTIKRDWRLAKAWLARELARERRHA